MKKKEFDSIFTFHVEKAGTSSLGTGKRIHFGEYILQCDGRTPIESSNRNGSQLILLGYAVDVISGETNQLADSLMKSTKSIADLLEREKRLGGKYLLFYRNEKHSYCIGDATGSIPVFYMPGMNLCCSSNMEELAGKAGVSVDQMLAVIRRSGDISQAMPYDITQYKEIKQLLPNHYLVLDEMCPVRFTNMCEKVKWISAEEAAEKTVPMIRNLAFFWKSHFRLYCPITGGRDSRVVLAVLNSVYENGDILAYTMKHGTKQDLEIPKKLTDYRKIRYEQIDDETVPKKIEKAADRLFGIGKYSKRTLMLAYTIFLHFQDGAIVNGDIIGQIGKCSLHRDIPEFFAKPSYFRCKLHNYSRRSKQYLSEWIKDIKHSEEKMNLFDLFSIESRMGRWAAQENIIYNYLGQPYLNIFNSRSIINIWTQVSRKERKEALIHKKILQKVDADMLNVPFERDKSLGVKLAKSSGMSYLVATYVKYLAEKTIFEYRNRSGRKRTGEKTDHNGG